ncbi:MAG: ABC transporter substrate-binding protein [Rhodospirillaceae bacterium]|nr:ABC transporter substrate-binding protein [Rhodospirillaceae bacterium]
MTVLFKQGAGRKPGFGPRVFQALLAGAALILTMLGPAGAQPPIHLTDLAGHEVVLKAPAQRILIADGRFLIALALIHPDPGSLLSAWPHDIDRIGPDGYEQLRQRSPGLAALPKTAISAAAQSVEQILAVNPDLAIFSLDSRLSAEERARIEAAGIPVLMIDFFIHPLAHVGPSLRLLGQATGRADQAEAFIAFRQAHLDILAKRLEGLADRDRPSVFLEPHAGISEECCTSPGNGNIGDYIGLAGGDNIGREVIPTAAGRLNLEYVIARAPSVYIATGGPYMERRGGVVLGPGFTPERARDSLVRAVGRRGFAELPAVRDKRAYGLSHQLLNSPLDILAAEMLAKAIHPERFADLDPGRTLDAINRDFLAFTLHGVYWTSLADGGL